MGFRGWFGGLRRPRGADEERVLRLESELQRARLEIEERDSTISRLCADAASARDGVGAEAEQRSRAATERFTTAMAVPLTQFLTQAHLHDSGAAEVRLGDVVEVGRRLMKVLGGAGVEQVGSIGATESFDPDRHDPLSDAAIPEPGRSVVVRVVGLSLHGKVLRKAGVENGGGS